jgi:glycosyltransferase involved in cell wall biosynthesis
MDNKHLVSIITVAYNADRFIEKTIQSVLSQTYFPIEYIIIDGGSTDNTVNIIKKYAHRIAWWCSEKDRGISDAFNKGLNKATGDIIGIINADDWYESDTIEKVVNDFGHSDVAYGDLQIWKGTQKDFIQKGNHRLLAREMTVNHPTVFIKKNCYEKMGNFSEEYKCAMDYDLLLRFYTNNCSFKYIPFVLSNMRLEGLSDYNWPLGCRETLTIKNKYLPTKKVKNYLYYCKHVLAIALPRALKKIGLHSAVKLYRSRFSQLKKVYHQ